MTSFTAMDIFDEAKRLHEVLDPEFARVYSIVKRTEYIANFCRSFPLGSASICY